MKILVFFLSLSVFSSAYAETVDCSEAYGTSATCEKVACLDKYKTFIGKWSGPFESYVQELSTETKNVFRPYHNTVTYSEDDCLRNVDNGDTFIIGRKVDVYPEFQGLAKKESKGLLITERRIDGSPFLRTMKKMG